MRWVLRILSLIVFFYGITIWLDLRNAPSDLYFRRSLQIPVMMFFSIIVVMFSKQFEGSVKGFSTYLEILGIIALLILISVLKGMANELGL